MTGRLTIRPYGLGDIGWAIQRHAEIYAEEFGWNAEFEALVAKLFARFANEHDRRLVDQCIAFARSVGSPKMILWTNDVLLSARRIYEAEGFRLVKEEPHHSFGKDLVGQFWVLELGERC